MTATIQKNINNLMRHQNKFIMFLRSYLKSSLAGLHQSKCRKMWMRRHLRMKNLVIILCQVQYLQIKVSHIFQLIISKLAESSISIKQGIAAKEQKTCILNLDESLVYPIDTITSSTGIKVKPTNSDLPQIAATLHPAI